MELRSLTVENFKRVKKAKIALSELNILVGSNGSGKSSILQAIHLGACLMRQTKELRADRTSPVSIQELDYLPSENYAELGHMRAWGNANGTPSSTVTLEFTEKENSYKAWCEFRAARNAGISPKGSAPQEVNHLFRGRTSYFSAYIPGISGIPNQEQKQSKRVVLKACSYGDSNVYLRNALVLLDRANIRQIEKWLEPLIGKISLKISHDNNKDLTINARAYLKNKDIPLELLGAGYLQLIQIFCYVLLFKPSILLIDEPDIHLHPDVQEKLAAILIEIAREMSIKVLLTTHSPFIVRGAPVGSNIYWMNDGKIEDISRDAIELSMGWGAFGKRVIIVSEDKHTNLLQKIVSQWPDIDSRVAFHPGRGYKSLLKKNEAMELYETLGKKYKILVHRDRDALTEDETSRLVKDYETEGVSLWFTKLSDVEAYFCSNELVAEIVQIDADEAGKLINLILEKKKDDISDQFTKCRKAHNEELYSAGGSPTNEEALQCFAELPLKGAKGKFIFNQIKNEYNKFSGKTVCSMQFRTEIAPELKQKITSILDI